MRRIHTEISFLIKWGELSFRLNQHGTITGHYRAYDRQTYHNTAALWKPGGDVDDERLKELLYRSFGKQVLKKYRQKALDAIQELSITWLPGWNN